MQPLKTPLSNTRHFWQTCEHWSEQFMSVMPWTLVHEFCHDLHEPFCCWKHPTECLSAVGRWSASSQNDPRHGHILLHRHPSCSKCRSQLSSRNQQILVSAGLRWDGLSCITVCVHGHCCICLVFSHKAAARGSKAEHQRHIDHYNADEKHLSGHRLAFLSSKIDLQ